MKSSEKPQFSKKWWTSEKPAEIKGAELEKALKPEAAAHISLDMSNVTFVDRKAMEFLCSVKSRVIIENVPSYVLRWIEQEFRCGQSQKEHSGK